jgi:D-proline reductase (dithiol) PrdB
MEDREPAKNVDSFLFLPRLIALFYRQTELEDLGPTAWTPFTKPLEQSLVGLVTSAGLYRTDLDPPFDIERERNEPTWGDPSFRKIPTDEGFSSLGMAHLHLAHEDILRDSNIVLPIERFQEMAEDGEIGGLTEHAFSFMGFQGYPPNWEAWREIYGPQVASQLQSEGADLVFLTPA